MPDRHTTTRPSTPPAGGGAPPLQGRLRLGDVGALLRVVKQVCAAAPAPGGAGKDLLAQRRRMLAEFCRMLGRQIGQSSVRIDPALAPRVRQTLELLLAGDGEKQIAAKLGVSQHTVHVYVKRLHKHYKVSSRAELLARFIPQPG